MYTERIAPQYIANSGSPPKMKEMEGTKSAPIYVEAPRLKHLTRQKYGAPSPQQNQLLQSVSRGHVESFNYFIKDGITQIIKNMNPVEFEMSNKQRISLKVSDGRVQVPMVPAGCSRVRTPKIYPAECRERAVDYSGRLTINIVASVDGSPLNPLEVYAGDVPIMLKSTSCNLHKLTPAQLVEHGEEAEELGGYFVVNGLEKLMRYLVMTRRNYPIALSRSAWKTRGPNYTDFGVQIRCVAKDLTSSPMVLHYLNTGSAMLCVLYQKEQFFLPVVMVMKALIDVSDRFIYNSLVQDCEDDSFYKGCVSSMLRQLADQSLFKSSNILDYIGERFRVKLQNLPPWKTNIEVAEFLLKECVCCHLSKNIEKFHLLVLMTKKLFAVVHGKCALENADNPMCQELLLSGQLIQMLLKERLEAFLWSIKPNLEKLLSRKGGNFVLNEVALSQCMRGVVLVTRHLHYLLATGNLLSKTGLGLMQTSGLCVITEKINFFRFLSHFRAVHRGAFFTEMRTTSARKLLPEAYGFLCPVHTPDGSLCGLLNHLAAACQVVTKPGNTTALPALLVSLGMVPVGLSRPPWSQEPYTVILDGQVIGWIAADSASAVVHQLRGDKVEGKLPRSLEICLVPHRDVAAQYPGLFIFSGNCRMVRPVHSLVFNAQELIGTFEQVYLQVALNQEEVIPGASTHVELSETAMLSVLANMTPFSDHNQSPRNMYQCQMGKQTMGTPCLALAHRADNKLYRLQTPQSPLVRPTSYDDYLMDEYPLGTNAVVAVISYTGYDMEDAMIINKASYDRGFGHGCIYKSQVVTTDESKKGHPSRRFGNVAGNKDTSSLDADGLPAVGTYLQADDVWYSTVSLSGGELKVHKYKSPEPAYIDQIKILGDDLGQLFLYKVCFVLRTPRNPIIGDKFASRHGQKGICSMKWAVEDMPFSEAGMTPDIIFNPHGFPSRMTIGMLIESMAGKMAATNAACYDATPFTFSEDEPAVEYFGKLLTEAGYNYFGTERLYSGVTGTELEASIFIGLVYYQRLRHMVSDKFQVRTSGPVDSLTRQPIKGRKRGGGIRFGEMERDALLAHGTSFLLQDRLLNCSDRTQVHVCRACGSILTPLLTMPPSTSCFASITNSKQWRCKVCDLADTIETLNVPFVFVYMCAELAVMNVRMTLDLRRTFSEP